MGNISKKARHLLHTAFFLQVGFLFATAPPVPGRRQKVWEPFVGKNFAHRGLHDNSWGIPENSMMAFKRAVDRNYGIELDVHLTADQQLVVHHDESLYRMCHIDRKIERTTLKELRTYHLLNTEETIPTLDEVLQMVNGQVPLLIELKCETAKYKELCRKVYEALAAYQGPFLIESFNPLVLRWFRKHHPDILRGQLSCNFFKEKPHCDLVLFLITSLCSNFLCRPDFISYKYTDIGSLNVRIACGLFRSKLAVWTIKSRDAYEKMRSRAQMFIFEGFLPDAPHASVRPPKSARKLGEHLLFNENYDASTLHADA